MKFALLFLFTATVCFGQAPHFEMQAQGVPLPTAKFDIVNKIPKSHSANLPKELPVFRYAAKPQEFPMTALQTLLDQSAFAGTNVNDLLQGQTNSNNGIIRLTTARDRDYFIVNPVKGRVSSQNGSHEVNLRQETPPRDGVPSSESISNSLLHYAELFGVSKNDMERNKDGSIHMRRTEDTITRLGGAVKYVDNRSTSVSRNIAGRVFWSVEDRIYLQLGIDGRLLRFEFNWRPMETVRTNRLFTTDEILDKIKKGEVLADITNEYPDDGIAKIILKDIQIDYYTTPSPDFRPASTNADIYPIASIYVTFKSKSGKSTDGGLFAPVVDSR